MASAILAQAVLLACPALCVPGPGSVELGSLRCAGTPALDKRLLLLEGRDARGLAPGWQGTP
eukprot:8695409-Heterocapsa_arctica.AAC.1